MSVPTVSPEGFSPRDVLPVNAYSHLRNRILGGIGMFSNIAALLLLWQSSRIRPPLKLVVISMSLCDLLTVTVAAIWGPHLPCWPALFFLSGTILTSYFMATLLAFHNYVAVFFPANCHQLLGFGRTAIIVTLCWVGGHLIILACLGGIHIPRGASCYVTAVMSREGLVAVSIICLLCCFLTIFMNLRVVMRIRRRPEHMALRVPVPAMIRESNMCNGVPKRADFLARIRKRRTSSVTPTSCFAFSLARLPGVCGTTLNGSVANLPDLVEAKCRKDTNDRSPRVPSLQRISNEARSVSQETFDLPERNDLGTADAAPKVLKTDFKLFRQDLHENGPSHSVGSADSESITIGNHALRSTRLRASKTLKSSKSCDTLQQQQQHHQQQQQCSEAPRLSFPQNASNAASWSNDTREKKVMTTPEIDINSEFIAKFHPIEHCQIDKQIPLKSTVVTVVNETLEFNSDVDCIRQFDSNAKSTATLGEIQKESIGNISPTNEETVVSFPINTQSKQSQRHVVFSISEQASCSSAARVLSRRHSTRCGRVCKKQELGLSRSYSAKNLKEDSSRHGECGPPILIQPKYASTSIGLPDKSNSEKLAHVTASSQSLEGHQKYSQQTCPSRKGSVASYNTFGVSNLYSEGSRVSENYIAKQENKQTPFSMDPRIFCENPSSSSSSQEHVQLRSLIKSSGIDTSHACYDVREQSASPTININREASSTTSASNPKPALNRPKPAVCISVSNSKSKAKNWRRRTQNTLLILCTWVCFLSFPYVVYGSYVAIWIEERASFSNSGFGMAISALALFSSITTPLLYAWRFVEWQTVWMNWRKKLTCYTYGF